MKHPFLVVPFPIFTAPLVGCNSPGTCMQAAAPGSDLGDSCTIGVSKKFCGNGEFREETPAQALLRCKSEGYELPVGQSDVKGKLDKGETVILYKPKK